jgi:hypothetical protein
MKAYGALALTESSPPQTFVEPFSISDARNFLNIKEQSPADPAEDALLSMYITAARMEAERLQNRDLVVKQYDLHLDLLLGHDAIAGAAYPLRWNSIYNFGVGYEIELRHPLISVDKFQHHDKDGSYTDLVEGNDYIVDTARSLVAPPWGKVWPFYTPWPTSSVLIRFSCGYTPDHPFWKNDGQRLIVGMMFLVSQWFNQRLPFEPGRVSQEFPNTVTDLLSAGARPRVH